MRWPLTNGIAAGATESSARGCATAGGLPLAGLFACAAAPALHATSAAVIVRAQPVRVSSDAAEM